MREPVKCEFTSVWSDGSIVTTPAIYYPEERRVEAEASDSADPDGYLEREFIEFEDGDTLEVCIDCHEYTLKPVMVPGVGHCLDESLECPNHDCISRE